MDFHKKLKALRTSNGWTIKFISKKLEVPYDTWVSWENGRNTPPGYTQKLILGKLKKLSIGEI